MEQDEQAIWQRIEAAVGQQPGPDPARLADIRKRLNTQRSVGRRNLWLAAALAAALGSTAAAALWIQAERGVWDQADAESQPDAKQSHDAMPDEPTEPAIESAPVEPRDQGEEASDPVIFRE